jgi:uncharacterized membrane protein YjjP (DUF1212 family)
MHNNQDVLNLAVGVGRVILENGGETYRAEETINRIAAAYGMRHTESFVVPTGIIVSLRDADGRVLTLCQRVLNRSINLEKVAGASGLSRCIERDRLSVADATAELKAINASNGPSLFKNMLFSGLVAAFFTAFFHGGVNEMVVAFVAGVSVAAAQIFSRKIGFGVFFGTLAGAIFAALIPTLLSLPPVGVAFQPVITGAIMLLVPGISMVNAIRDTISSEILSGTTRAVEALVLAAGIAMGTGVTLKLFFMLRHSDVSNAEAWHIALEPFFAAAAAYAFAAVFNVRQREALVSGIAGGAVWGLFMLARKINISEPACYFLAALGAGLISEILAKVMKKPVSLFIVPAIIPLVPGAMLYYTMEKMASGDYPVAWSIGAKALVMSGAIATALAFATSLSRIYGRVRHGVA